MKTPAGNECRYYYEDFHRGRDRQECRLIGSGAGRKAWQPADCATCPVPEILWANASPYLELHAEINPGILGIGRQVKVTAICTKHEQPIEDPHVGCRECAAERTDLFAFNLGDEDN